MATVVNITSGYMGLDKMINNEFRAGIKIREPIIETFKSLSFVESCLKIHIPIKHQETQYKENAYMEEL